MRKRTGVKKKWRVYIKYDCNGDEKSRSVSNGGKTEEMREKETTRLRWLVCGKKVYCERKSVISAARLR
jgi:hypothetical protein